MHADSLRISSIFVTDAHGHRKDFLIGGKQFSIKFVVRTRHETAHRVVSLNTYNVYTLSKVSFPFIFFDKTSIENIKFMCSILVDIKKHGVVELLL